MADTSEIDDLLSKDSANVDTCKAFLRAVSPSIPEAISEASSLFTTLNRVYAQSQQFADHFREVKDFMKATGLDSDRELLERAKTDSSAKRVYSRFQAREARALLLMRAGVLYDWAFTDFLRMRVTGPLAYLRVQVETIALIVLMTQDPDVAHEWFEIGSDEGGKKFFRNHQSRIIKQLRDAELLAIYELASAGAVHSRLAGLCRSASVVHETSQGERRTEYRVRHQEFDPADPVPFELTVVNALRVQERIFRQLVRSLDEIDDPIFIQDRIPRFAALVDEAAEVVRARHQRRAEA